MSTNNGPDDKTPEMREKEQRPYATLDLTAQDVSSKKETGQDTSGKPAASGDEKSFSAADKVSPQEGASADSPAESSRALDVGAFSIESLATHLAAGAVGGILALILVAFIPGETEAPANSAAVTEALRTDLADATQRISSLEGELRQAMTKTQNLESAAAEAQRLEKNLVTLTDRVQAVESRPGSTGISEQAVQQSLDPFTSRLANVEERLNELAKAQNENRTNSKAAALALALYNLRRAADEGKPFSTELASIAAMSPVPLDLTELEERRDQGVPSLDQLKLDFNGAANAALDAESKPAEDSFVSELWAKTKSFVRVRRKGDVPGETTRAILARIEHRLEGGDLSAALAESKQLRGAALEPMKPWLAELEAKVTAENALRQVEAKLLSALGGEDTAKRGG